MTILLEKSRLPSSGACRPESPHAAATAAAPQSGFLLGSTYDLFFIANLFWPLLLVFDLFGGVEAHEGLLFWQIYFITTPHRWITLLLVTCDREKTRNRTASFLLLGGGILAACLCARLGTGSLLCLGAIDYLWNAWHFASQHHGIFRIYERKLALQPAPWTLTAEKVVFRGFLLYVIARVAGWGWSDGAYSPAGVVAFLDLALLLIPGLFVGRQVWRYFQQPDRSLGGVAYLTSMMTLFAAMLLAAHFERHQLVLQLALASAIFHAVEYMGVVTWSVRHSKVRSRTDLFGHMSRMWLLYLAVFIVVIGAGNYLLSRGMHEVWVLANFVMAFWHYSFDGMIWKSPKGAKPALAGGAAP